eukprot:m.33345 g.33345  ORF g.33345 m.33345 type:complete len:348 (-) comp16802_c0_seq1:103-1146(-)
MESKATNEAALLSSSQSTENGDQLPNTSPNNDHNTTPAIEPAVEVEDPDAQDPDSDENSNDDASAQGSNGDVIDRNAHNRPPTIADSEEHEVSFLGRLLINGTDREPPTGAACATSVDYLARLSKKQRAKFRGNVAIDVKMTVSAARQQVVCIPRTVTETERGLSCNLIHVTCVADHGKHICFITAKLQPDRSVQFHAFAFVCESEFASRYLAEEVVRACRHVFMLRRIQRVQEDAATRSAQTSPRPVEPVKPPTPPAPPKENRMDRKPNEADKMFFKEWELMEFHLAATTQSRPPNSPNRLKPSRGDGFYYECCKHLGGCTCTNLVAAPIQTKTNSESQLVVAVST